MNNDYRVSVEYDGELESDGIPTNLLKHIINSYGGITSLLSSMTKVIKYIPSIKYQKYSKYISLITRGTAISMVTYDFYTKVKEYYDEKNSNIKNVKSNYIHTMLGNNDGEFRYRYDSHELHISSEHIDWLLDNHNDDMGGIVIKSYCDIFSGKIYSIIPDIKEFAVLIEFRNILMLIEIDQLFVFNNKIYTYKKLWTLNNEEIDSFVDTMNAKYMDSVGFDKNVITYDGVTINSRPRSNIIDFEITSIDFNCVCNTIKQTLDNCGRRGILFTGNPGTGKTSVLLKLEETLIDYPILYATANNLNDEYNISRLETFIHNIGKCIVFIEDMDALEIDRKTKKIGPFLSLLDNSRNLYSVVFVATINDASLITPSIARTGRFDEVIEIKEPTSNKEIYEILRVAWMRNSDANLDGDLSFWTYFRLKFHKLTQSDYCEIVQKICIRKDEFNDKNVIVAMKELVKSKKTFKKYRTKHV